MNFIIVAGGWEGIGIEKLVLASASLGPRFHSRLRHRVEECQRPSTTARGHIACGEDAVGGVEAWRCEWS